MCHNRQILYVKFSANKMKDVKVSRKSQYTFPRPSPPPNNNWKYFIFQPGGLETKFPPP